MQDQEQNSGNGRSRGSDILLTGATGFVGGRLVPRLLEAGYRVRCLARSPRKLDNRSWSGHPNVEIVAGDVGDAASLGPAMAGCAVAYYLVHSMESAAGEFSEVDRRLATNFASAASAGLASAGLASSAVRAGAPARASVVGSRSTRLNRPVGRPSP